MTKMQLVNDINAPRSVSRQAESPLLRDLVNDMNAVWSMTQMQLTECKSNSMVNDKNAVGQ